MNLPNLLTPHNINPLLAFGIPNGWEWLLIALLGLLFFGKRLPEVGRSLGLGIVEFKKGLKGVSEEVETASAPAPQPRTLPADQPAAALPDVQAPAAQPRFDPYTGKPLQPAPPQPAFDPYTGKPLNQNT